MKKDGKLALLLRAIIMVAVTAVLVFGLKWFDANVQHTPVDNSKVGTAAGFGGDVTAKLTLGKDGSISEVELEGPGETADIGGAALEELAAQVKAAQGPEIDGVAGASITSQAVREAVAQAMGVEVAAPETEEATETTTEIESAPETEGTDAEPVAYQAGTYTGSAMGFGGDVTATVTIGEDGAISDVVLEGEGETPEIGGAALEELQSQVMAAQGAGIDGVSGASVTSQGVKDAVGYALKAAAGEETAAGDVAFTPGTYTGTATGFGGEVAVTLTVTEDDITEVEIVGDKETVNIGTFAVELLDDVIEEANTCKVDALTGATVTSNAIKKAAADALTQAGADVNALPSAEKAVIATEDKASEEINTQIVIVGAGGAGMTAAIKATQAGKDVILLEKMPYAGGNTTKATGGMNAAETHYQAEQGIEDTIEQFVEDTMKGGHDINDIDLVTKMASESAACIEWLDSIDAPLPKLSFSGGATNSRIHAPEDGSGVGAYLVTAFLKQLDTLGINVMYNTTATSIIMDGDKAVGVMAEGDDTVYTINAEAVILTTGGFGANNDMIVSFREDLDGTVTTNTPAATGDGIIMAQAVGADTRDLEQIQLHPTVEQATSMLITEGVRGDGAILVNQEGKRFTNELLTRDAVSAAELAQTGCYAYIIFDQNLRDNLKAIQKYVDTNITVQADTIEGLAELIDIDPATLAETLAAWNECVAKQEDTEFGRETGMDHDLSVAPYYAIKIAPGIHHTMGGVKINTEAEVLNTEGNVIPGLYAAGEVTGGVHGGNRLGGNAVADIVVFGNTAGTNAAEYVGDAAPEAAPADDAEPADDAADTLTGVGAGFGGNITATLTMGEDGAITDVVLDAPDETPTIGGAALEELQAQVIAAQSAEIDGISGASLTSAGVKEAVAAALASANGEPAEALAFTAGTYTGVADGYNGPVELAVTFSEDAVTGIEVVANAETAYVGTPAFDIIIEDAIAANGSGVDAVSGATFTSRAVKNALNAAAEEAGCTNMAAFKSNTVAHEPQADIEETVDVVIVGAGGAGMGAAAQAAMNGDSVIVIEENVEIGGNTLVSGGQFQAAMPYLVWDPADPDATEAVWDYDGQTYAKIMSTQGNIDVLKVIAEWSEEPFNGDYFVENEYVAGEIDDLSKQGVHQEYLPVLQELKAEISEYLAWAQPKLDAGIPENEITLFSTDNLHIFQTYYGGLRQNADKTDWIYGDVELVSQFVKGGYELKTWLEDQGAKFADGDQLILIGALWYRENRQLGADLDGDGEMEYGGNWGAYFAPTVNTLLNTSATADQNKIMTRTKGESLIIEDGRVVGVNAVQYDGTKVTLHAKKGVILATGGYAANIEMVMNTNQYWDPSYITDATKTTNRSSLVGDGITMGEEAGADTVGTGWGQMMPISWIDNGNLSFGGGQYAAYINPTTGKRFVNESAERDVLSLGEFQNGVEVNGAQGVFLEFSNADVPIGRPYPYDDYSTGVPVASHDQIDGRVYFVSSQEELQAVLDNFGMTADPAVIYETLEAYDRAIMAGEQPEVHKAQASDLIGHADLDETDNYNPDTYTLDGVLLRIRVMAPSTHHTMGGLRVDIDRHVLDADGNIVPGLYAAGEVTGGIHGGNRLGGNAIVEIFVSGRVAANAINAETPVEIAAVPETSEEETKTEETTEIADDALTGVGAGFGGNITATLTMGEDGTITDVVLDAPDETPNIGGAAIEELTAQVLAAQGAEIDGVSGASLTSAGVKEAVAAALASAEGEAAEELAFTAGTYTGVADGYNGPVELAVTFSDTALTGVEVVANAETAHVGTPAIDIIVEDAIAANGSGVDAVSGATFTSRAVKNALNAAAEEAGCTNMAAFKANSVAHEPQADIEETVDVVVVGAGGAGMGAAAQAAMNGQSVIVVEENVEIGGNTLVSGGQFQATMPYLVWDPADPDAAEAVWDYDGQTYAKIMSTQGNIEVLKTIAEWSEEPFNGEYFVDHEYVAGEIDDLSKQGVHQEYLPVLQALKAEINEYLAWAQPKLDAGVPENEITLFSTDNLHIFQTYYGGLRQNADKTDWIYGDVELVSQFVKGGYELKTWLEDQGAKFADGEQLILIGALWYRENRQLGADLDGDGEMEEGGNWGAYFAPTVNTLLNTSATADQNKIMTRTKAESLIMEDGRVAGINATMYDGTKVTLHANKGVILATGGYAANIQMVMDTNAYWDPSYITDATKTTNRNSLVGDGIVMGEEAGAATVGTGWGQMMPISWIDNGNLAFGGGQYAAYINPTTGKRFVNESAERDVLSLGEFRNGVEVNGAQGVFLEFSNADVPIGRPYPYDDYSTGVPVASHDQVDGRVFFISNQEELQGVLDTFGMTADPAEIYATLEAYDRAIMAGEQPEVHKAQASNLIGHAELDETDNYNPDTYTLDGVLLRIRVMAPSTHHTMGGLSIDIDRHVLDIDGNIIPGLYAAGEVTGGIHGGNRLGGNAIVEIFVSGRVAADTIAAE